MSDLIKTTDLFSIETEYLKELFSGTKYPFEILPKIKEYAIDLIKKGITGYTLLSENVMIGPDVKIHKTATIIGPTIIGKGTEIRPGAFIRGNVITGENCVIGNSTELKNCVLLNSVQAPHYNYIGDSILGNKAHTGAGVILSNLKADKKDVVIHGKIDINTNLKKLGGILGDGADIGCGTVLNPGTVIGKNTSVYPLSFLRGVYPADCIVKSNNNVVKRI